VPEPTERHYNISRLNLWFAVSSLLFIVCFVALFAEDYGRDWKQHQYTFRRMQAERLSAEYQEELERIANNEEYQHLTAQLEEAAAKLEANRADLRQARERLAQLETENYIKSQTYQFAKSDYEAAEYAYEAARARGSRDVNERRQRMEELGAKMAELELIAERSNAEVRRQQAVVRGFTEEKSRLEKERDRLTRRADLLYRNLKKVDPEHMSLANRMAESIRNLPVMDAFAPSVKIDQVVVKDITEDVVFARVPRVDRCTTCHVGIMQPGFEDAEQPYRTHPNLDLYLGSESPHPLEQFGCTSCHGGRGRGTDFISAVHMPSTLEQKKGWEEKYDWHKLHHWERPMYPLKYVEAGCFECHSGETVIPGADTLNLGLNLVEKAGCYGCHNIDKYKGRSEVGPSLAHLASKVDKDWAWKWINNPKSFRHNTWMPQFFGLYNNSDEASVRRSEQEIHSIVHYLMEHSRPFELESPPVAGDPARGEELVASVGCFGCHQIEHEPTGVPSTVSTLRREHGPNLIGLGTKTSREWLYSWLKNPTGYHAGTRMPNLRLTDQESADIAAFLASDSNETFANARVPPIDESILDEIAYDFLKQLNTHAEAEATLADMTFEEKLEYNGTKLIRFYGCYGCHSIPGFEDEKPIGTDLTEEGSKSVHKLDFGFVDIEHVNYAWFDQKLRQPRIFDKDRVKPPADKLRMPDFGFTNEEVDALVTVLLSWTEPDPMNRKIKPRTPRNLYIERGQFLVREYNCRGCHLIEGQGGAINDTITDWLVRYEDKSESEAEAQATSFSPPNLVGEGKKVQSDWLFEFLHRPSTIRPWLQVRMPTFPFEANEINGLVRYFAYLDNEEFPFTEPVAADLTPSELEAAKALFSEDYFSCGSCHVIGDQLPAGSPDSWAPNFALAKHRLKPDWIIDWMKDPQGLLPGTKMPTYFPEEYFDEMGPEDILDGDENRQIEVLRDYILTIPDATEKSPSPADTSKSGRAGGV